MKSPSVPTYANFRASAALRWKNGIRLATKTSKGRASPHSTQEWIQPSRPSPRHPPDALILTQQTSGALFYCTNFTLVRWDSLASAAVPRLAARHPLYAVLFPHETVLTLKTHAAGHWAQIGAIRHVTFWQWLPLRS